MIIWEEFFKKYCITVPVRLLKGCIHSNYLTDLLLNILKKKCFSIRVFQNLCPFLKPSLYNKCYIRDTNIITLKNYRRHDDYGDHHWLINSDHFFKIGAYNMLPRWIFFISLMPYSYSRINSCYMQRCFVMHHPQFTGGTALCAHGLKQLKLLRILEDHRYMVLEIYLWNH